VQTDPAAQQNPWMLLLQCALALVLPLAGIIICALLLASHRLRDAGMVAASTVLGAVLYAALFL
jgi:hypothetical protein